MERGFAEAAANWERTWQAMERGFAEAAADRQRIRRDVSELQRDVRDLKGDVREQYYRSRATGIFSRRLLQGHDVTSEVADQLRSPLQEGRISPGSTTLLSLQMCSGVGSWWRAASQWFW